MELFWLSTHQLEFKNWSSGSKDTHNLVSKNRPEVGKVMTKGEDDEEKTKKKKMKTERPNTYLDQ